MKYKICAVATIGLLSACASNVPMKIVSAPNNRNADQRQLDSVECSNASHAEAPLLFGVGPALARSRAAKLYTECMKKKGYVVERGEDDDEDKKPAPTLTDINPSPNASKLSLAYPDGWEQQPLTDEMQKNGIAIAASNITGDAGLRVSTRDAKQITDVDAYTQSRLAAQLSMLKQPTHSEVEALTVNGHRAKRYEVAGEAKNGVRYKYNTTLIFGAADVVSISAFTTELNYANQKSGLEVLAERISGIK
jgi:hypothetical protein